MALDMGDALKVEVARRRRGAFGCFGGEDRDVKAQLEPWQRRYIAQNFENNCKLIYLGSGLE